MATWEDVRELALALPEVEESTSWRQPCFKVRGKTFAGVSRHEGAIWARCDHEERPLLIETNADAYRLTPHFQNSPAYLLIWLEHIEVVELRERLEDAWLLMAPQKLVRAFLDATPRRP